MIRRALNFTASSLLLPAFLCLAVSALLPLQAAGQSLYKVSPKIGPRSVEAQSVKPAPAETSVVAPAPEATPEVVQASYVPVDASSAAKKSEKPTLHRKAETAEKQEKSQPAKRDRHPVVLSPIPLIPDTPLPPEWIKAAEQAAKTEASSKSPEVPVSLQTDLNPKPDAATLTSGQPPAVSPSPPKNGRVQFTAPSEISPEPELDITTAPALRPATPIVSPASEPAVPPEKAKASEKSPKPGPQSQSQKAVNVSTRSKKASKSNPRTTHAVKEHKEKKPVVHFPVAMPDGLAGVAVTRRKLAPRFAYPFPSGYKAYIPPAVGQQYEVDQAAIEHFNRANHMARRDRMADADAEYRMALTLNPDFADAYVGLSSVHLRKNDWENVFDETDRALSLKTGFRDPANIVQAEFNRSVAFCAANDRRNANRYFKRVKKAGHPLADPLHAFLMHNCKP